MQHVDVILEGVVVPVNEGMDVFKEGMVAIKDGFIVDVGESAAKRNEYSATKVFSLKNKIIMPGLVNAHTHVAMTYIRCMADDMNLYDWLKKSFGRWNRFLHRKSYLQVLLLVVWKC